MDLTKEFPRSGSEILGGYPWIARMIDKARAYVDGTLGDYIYPCPIDKELLAELNVTGQEFADIVEDSPTDDQILQQLRIPMENNNPEVAKWTKEFLENRHDSLKRQAEEEGRQFVETSPRMRA